LNKKILKSGVVYLILLAFIVYIAASMVVQPKVKEITNFNEFIDLAKNKQIKSAIVYDNKQMVEGTLTNKQNFRVSYARDFPIETFMLKEKVPFSVDNSQSISWTEYVPFLLFAGFIIFLLFFIMQQVQGGGSKVMSFGKARVKRPGKEQPKVTFKEVAGVDEAVEELSEIRDFLANPGKFQAMGAKIPKGLLLYGPPGSGKTLLARAVAGEAAVPFFSISGSDFVEMFVGVGASRVRDLFEQAKMHAPSIIFMDEIDAVGRHRGAGLGGGHDEREQTLNQLLVEMDGFDIKDNVILIAATNRPDILDPALLRPGRFDRQIVVDRPDLNGRLGILKIHTKNKPLAKQVDLEVLARRTPGFTGADLANLVNEGALLAARYNKKRIEMKELEEAIDRVMAGPERKTRLISDKEKQVIAYHESGHALVAHSLPKTDPVHKISIIPRGRALGYTLTLPTEDRYLVAKTELLDELAMLVAGRVAEEMVFKDATTGAQNDLERATKLARKMVCEYGMSEKLGPLTLGQKQEQVFLGKDFGHTADYSPEIAYQIDKEIRRIVDEAWEKAHTILKEKESVLKLIATSLIQRETIEKDDLARLLDGKRIRLKTPKSEAVEEKTPLKEPSPVKKKLTSPGKLRPVES